ncbi:MAG: cyclic nucleotide-binding domain-containing protein [Hydrogenoanaerobacterium sp.]
MDKDILTDSAVLVTTDIYNVNKKKVEMKMEKNMMMRFCEDDVILTQGSEKREMYKILSGKAAVYFNYGTPEEYLIGVLSEQRCFGELSILCGKPSAHSVVALGEMLVLRITEHTFDDFIKNNTQNAIGIMRNLARTVDTLSFNLNMVNEDLATMSSVKDDVQKMQDITQQVRQRTAMDAVQKALFIQLI